MDAAICAFVQALLTLNRPTVRRLVEAGKEEVGVLPFIEAVVVPSLEHIGKEWEVGNLALSQVYMSGKICEELVDTILPAGAAARRGQPPMAIAQLCDYHSLGKTIIRSALRASGFELLDFGRVETEELAGLVAAHGIRVMLLSVLMLPSALQVGKACDLLRRANQKVSIVVGGAPFRLAPQLWREVGADAMGRDSAQAIAIVRQLVEEGT